MYDYFKGQLTTLTPTSATVDCNGVGYLLHISLTTFAAIKELKQVKLLAHLIVREDAQELYGFFTEEERQLFRQLISVSGVGASTGRIILSSMPADELRSIIASGNSAALQKVKGIGAKTAQRIIIDLKDKVLKSGSDFVISSAPHNTIRSEALSALLILGFGRPNAEKAIDQVLRQSPSASVEAVIKTALNLL
ncbi:MAG: Holliday junction branch migration protein RuvA [Bacteroidota bacterium]